jgi:hypothetical protein
MSFASAGNLAPAERPSRMTKHRQKNLEEALADIRMLARFALQSDDHTHMKRDLEMILTITEMVLPGAEVFNG